VARPIPAADRRPEAAAVAPELAAAPRTEAPGLPRLTVADSDEAAYLVDERFRLVWWNEAARRSDRSPIAPGLVAGASVFQQLLPRAAAEGGEVLLRFHLQAARARGAGASELFEGLPPAEAQRLEAAYRELPRPAAPGLVAQALLPRRADLPASWIHAVHFHQGVLFVLRPPEAGEAAPGEAAAPAAPMLTPVAVLAMVLQDAGGLWVRLAAEEYFELLNEVGAELDAIFRRHQGHAPAPAGEARACYFLPAAAGNHLWNALSAAHQAREAMRQVSQRWQVRKGWDLELHLNIGIDEGQDWLGALTAADRTELRVLGDAASHAAHLARCGRAGTILLTRNLVGKLPREQRQRLTYGAPRLDGSHAEAPLLFTFARLADVAAPGAAPPAVADLAVAELIDLHSPASHPTGSSR
jgi:class 3 adenylate cyclase